MTFSHNRNNSEKNDLMSHEKTSGQALFSSASGIQNRALRLAHSVYLVNMC